MCRSVPRDHFSMRLPNARHAIIDESKVRDYLLAPHHPNGAAKARFFLRLGFTADTADILRRSLAHHARHGAAEPTDFSPYGIKFEVRGILHGTRGQLGSIISVWMYRRDEYVPRFVTFYPRGRR